MFRYNPVRCLLNNKKYCTFITKYVICSWDYIIPDFHLTELYKKFVYSMRCVSLYGRLSIKLSEYRACGENRREFILLNFLNSFINVH